MKLVYAASEREWVQRWKLHFDLVEEPFTAAADEFYLFCDRGELLLCRGDDRRGVGVTGGGQSRRSKGKFALGQAVGSPGNGNRVVDATAGLGGDLLMLRGRGYQVQGYECNPVLWALLDSYLRVQGITDVELHLADSMTAMREGTLATAQVIYLDPMFPEEHKRALPGKSMQYLRELLPEPAEDAADMVAAACQVATDRVVLKRRRRDPIIGKPSWQIKGSSVRFDVYSTLGGTTTNN